MGGFIEKLASQVTFLANFDVKMSNYVRDRFCDTAFCNMIFLLVKFCVLYIVICAIIQDKILFISKFVKAKN